MEVGTVLVLPSPLVGSGAYAVLAQAFRDAEVSAEVAEPPGGLTSGGEVLRAFAAVAERERPDVVVAHSNAGLVAPAVADGIPLVFVDAALPAGEGESPMAPPAMLGHLAALADGHGVLPPWTQWWDEEDVAPLFPDARARAAVEASEPRLPLGYFRTTVPSPKGWERGPRAYLAFGATYAVELARARRLGWPTGEVEGARHLHFLHDPAGVARAVVELAQGLTGGGGAARPV
ncbi:alpha/beta fold hydrolase [Knoellia sp. LjRoot47]|uniref:alpha/beta fold hydrolase n=1 Tax=Knoellia sp. LjRoot47 TaxID=3342330 RepID=UPI003ED0BB2E